MLEEQATMGIYVNPPREAKERFLGRVGTQLPVAPGSILEVPVGHCVVCLVDNGMWTGAGVMYSDRELAKFMPTKEDQRSRTWYAVPLTALRGTMSRADWDAVERGCRVV